MTRTKRVINQAIQLYRDDPIYNEEISARDGFPWRCDIWEKDGIGTWPLFATAWGKTRIEAQAKANSIIQACGRDHWVAERWEQKD